MIQPDDPWTDEDRRNQQILGHMNKAQFSFHDEHGNDATNSLAGGAAWARTHMAALSDKNTMPVNDFAGVEHYRVKQGGLSSESNVVGLYHPASRTVEFGMAYPTRGNDPVKEATRDKKFRRAFIHEHGHHQDNMVNGAMDLDIHSRGHLEARAENYADVHADTRRSGYDEALNRGLGKHFASRTDATGEQGMKDFETVRTGGDMPNQPRRVRDSSGALKRPTPAMMPNRRA